MLEKAIEAIEAQQAKLEKFSSAFYVGEQLKEIISKSPTAAELVAQDLEQTGMAITDCEKKIAAFANAHKSGNCGCCPPNEAEKIICEFYGISSQPVVPEKQGFRVLNLVDLISEV